jgi:hypothetical protein
MGEGTATLSWGGRKSIVLSGFVASPSRPSDKSRVDMKTLEWLEAGLENGALEF